MSRPTTLLLALTLAVIATGLAPAISRQDAGPDVPVDTRAKVRTYLRDLMARYEDRAEQSYRRYLSSPREQIIRPRGRLDPLANPDESRLQTLEDRAERRAYDGAPPVMPHSKNFAATKACLDCHADGMFLGDRYARPISHARLVNCEQCHVEARNMFLDFYEIDRPNDFEGLRPPVGGRRYTEASPPVMPHGTFMRVNCLACHGPNGYRGLRTSHPGRLNCVQCHAVGADIDESSPYFDGNPTLVLPRAPEVAPSTGTLDPRKLPSKRDGR